MPYVSRPITERFASRYKVAPETGCWEWQQNLMPSGYGRFCTYGGETMLAHRFAYEYYVGEIGDGLHIDHLCRNRGCVNPEHLEAVTPHENNIRSLPYRKKQSTATHCANGHRWTKKTRYEGKDGYIACRTCRNQSEASRRRRVAA